MKRIAFIALLLLAGCRPDEPHCTTDSWEHGFSMWQEDTNHKWVERVVLVRRCTNCGWEEFKAPE